MAPPNIQVLVPRPCESPFTLYGKVGWAAVIKVRVLGDYPSGPQMQSQLSLQDGPEGGFDIHTGR